MQEVYYVARIFENGVARKRYLLCETLRERWATPAHPPMSLLQGAIALYDELSNVNKGNCEISDPNF
jgi:hypothetical protein